MGRLQAYGYSSGSGRGDRRGSRLARLRKGKIALELATGRGSRCRRRTSSTCRASWPGAVVDGLDAIWALRMIKSSAEAEVMREVCDHTCEAFRIGFEALRGGMTEREPRRDHPRRDGDMDELAAGLHRHPLRRLKYTMMNVPPFDKVMEPGDLIVVDGGAFRHYFGAT